MSLLLKTILIIITVLNDVSPSKITLINFKISRFDGDIL